MIRVLKSTDGAGHPGLSVHQGTLPWARHGVGEKTNALFLLRPYVSPGVTNNCIGLITASDCIRLHRTGHAIYRSHCNHWKLTGQDSKSIITMWGEGAERPVQRAAAVSKRIGCYELRCSAVGRTLIRQGSVS